MNNSTAEVMVSICCITYNHEQYIAEALESFLMQETTFKFEIIIGEDASKDRTRAIIERYAADYPEQVKLVGHDMNIGAIRNQIDVIARAKGKYIAMCDGDDFWIDSMKLQKQVDFLEANPEYIICCNHTRVINEHNELVYVKDKPTSLEFDYHDILLGRREETRICSLMIRNGEVIRALGKEPWYMETHGSDTLFKLYAVAKTNKKIFVLPEVMACYRWHSGGIWSMIDAKIRKGRMISDFNLTINNFKYSSIQKRELLSIYFKEYFLFDIRYFNFNQAVKTIATLW